jgi:hypothetical protein
MGGAPWVATSFVRTEDVWQPKSLGLNLFGGIKFAIVFPRPVLFRLMKMMIAKMKKYFYYFYFKYSAGGS